MSWLEGLFCRFEGDGFARGGPPFVDVIGPGSGYAMFVAEAGVVAGGGRDRGAEWSCCLLQFGQPGWRGGGGEVRGLRAGAGEHVEG